MIIAVLVLLVLLGALALTAQYWIVLFVLVLLGFGGHSGFRWSAESLQVGFLLAAVLAVAACAWLSSGQRAALRAPLRPGVALPLGCICCSLGMCFTLVSRSPVRPAWKVMHDGALVALLLDSAARDEPEPFFDARQELLRRRHSERSRRLESAALELRRVAGGPASLSARLAAQYEANPRPPQHSEDLLGGGYVASLVGNGAPELAVIDVLLARGETREALAWIADVGVPLGLRIEIAKRWSQLPALPRPIVIATLGRACVDAQKRRGPADVPLFAYQSSCDFALDRLLPREPSALTAPQGFALAYALTAVDSSLIDERLSLTTKDDVAVAMLRGIRAARLSNANRSHTIEDRTLSCDRLEQLAALVCPAVRPRICGTEAAIRSLIPLEILDPCLAQLAIETPPELVSLGGY